MNTRGRLSPGTMATVAVFAPLFFISGIVGQFIKSIPLHADFRPLRFDFRRARTRALDCDYVYEKESNRLEKIQEEIHAQNPGWYRVKLGYILDNRRAQNIFLVSIFAAFSLHSRSPITRLLKTTFFPRKTSDTSLFRSRSHEPRLIPTSSFFFFFFFTASRGGTLRQTLISIHSRRPSAARARSPEKT